MAKIWFEVPDGPHCWNHQTTTICSYFDNEGGHPSCMLYVGSPSTDKKGRVVKPTECHQREAKSDD